VLVNKIHSQPKMQRMICTMPRFVRFFWISGVLNDSLVSDLCDLVTQTFQPQWSHFLQEVHASVCRSHAFVWCCIFPKSLLVGLTFRDFPCCSLSSEVLPVFSETCIFKPVQVLNQNLVSILLNGALHYGISSLH